MREPFLVSFCQMPLNAVRTRFLAMPVLSKYCQNKNGSFPMLELKNIHKAFGGAQVLNVNRYCFFMTTINHLNKGAYK